MQQDILLNPETIQSQSGEEQKKSISTCLTPMTLDKSLCLLAFLSEKWGCRGQGVQLGGRTQALHAQGPGFNP